MLKLYRCIPLLLLVAFSITAHANQTEQLYQKYQRQIERIERIEAQQEHYSSFEQEALKHRLLERHLSAFETLDALSNQLSTSPSADPEMVALTVELLIQQAKVLSQAIDSQQELFKQRYAELEAEPAKAFRVYLTYLSRLDLIFDYSTKTILHLEKLDTASTEAKQELIGKLYQRTETFSGMIALVAERKAELETILKVKPDDQATKDDLAILQEQLNAAGGSFKLSVDLLSQLGFNSDFYQQTLLSLGGQITTDVLDVHILSKLLKRWGEIATNYFIENGGEWVFKLILLIAIFYIFRALSRLTRKVITKSLAKSNLRLSSLMENMIISLATRFVMIIGVLVALAQLGISLAPVLAGLGVAGFIIGFALQDTLSNFAAGMMILIYRPYDVGDAVEVSGVFGKVETMSLVSTTVLTFDNQTLVIPNSKIWGGVIKNVTAQRLRRVDLVFGIGYGDDIEKAEKVLMDVVTSHAKVVSDPEPVVKVHTLNESSVDFVVRPWVPKEDYWDVYWDLTRAVKMRFDKEGISIPFPQRDVHLFQNAD